MILSSCLLAIALAGVGRTPSAPRPILLAADRFPATDDTRAPELPACRDFAERLVLCLELRENDRSRLLTWADLGALGEVFSVVEARAVKNLLEGWSAQRLERVRIPDDGRSYWMADTEDGLDQAAFFAPDAVAAQLGGPVALATPARGVLFAFSIGDRELEQMVAVGVDRAWKTLDGPISPVLYVFKDGRWVFRSQALPSEPSASPASPQAP
jgi:hypothetical protein